MNGLAGFTALTLVASNPVHQVFRAVRVSDQQAVILKILDTLQTSIEDQARLRHEYRLLSSHPADGWSRALALHQQDNLLALVLADDHADDLATVLNRTKLSLPQCLALMIGLTDIVGQLHQCGIIHRDINPANLILLQDQLRPKLIDFGIAIESQHGLRGDDQAVLAGSLRYIAPEQTGKMNRQVDYRADFYALGVTFYEMLLGRPPFDSLDPHELIHAHVARRPVPPSEQDASIPAMLSAVVMKLLAKNAEQRYQSSHGLLQDLQRCVELLDTQGLAALQQAEWVLGEQDRVAHFAIPEKLYGREAELQTLQRGFVRVRQGRRLLFLVTGESGAGKTALVRELHRTVLDSSGALVFGKFDQLQRDIPYHGWLLALRQWARQLLSASDSEVAYWRTRLCQAVEGNGSVLLDAIPELQWVLGEQSANGSTDPIQQQQLFNHIMMNALAMMGGERHPLVVVLDDMQWADAGSLSLLERMLLTDDISHVMVIGIYRGDETGEHHPLTLAIDSLRRRGIQPETLQVDALTLPALQQLIEDTFGATAAEAHELASIVLDKTRGNPFYIEEFLGSLVADRQIWFDFAGGRWQWQAEQLQARSATLNVVDLLVQRLRELDSNTIGILQTAACSGFEFLLQDLLAVSTLPAVDVMRALRQATRHNIIQPVGDAYLADVDHDDLAIIRQARLSYRFVHDRVHQSVYDTIAPAQRQQLHLRMAQRLYQTSNEEERARHIFEIARHFNAAVALLQGEESCTLYLQINLQAAQKAIAGGGFDKAYQMLIDALPQLSDAIWASQYALALAFYRCLIESAYFCADYEGMNHHVKTLESKVCDPLDVMRSYHVQMRALNRQGLTQEAVDLGIARGSLVGLTIARHPTRMDVLLSLLRTKFRLWRALGGRSILDLALPPPVQDARRLARYEHMFEIAELAFLARPNVFAEISFFGVRVALDDGVSRTTPGAYAAFAVLHCAILDQIDRGFDYMRFAMRAADQMATPQLSLVTTHLHNAFIRHWKEPLRASLGQLQWVQRYAAEIAHLVFSCHGANMYLIHLWFCGMPLEELAADAERYGKLAHRYGYDQLAQYPALLGQVSQCLQGYAESPVQLIGERFDESGFDTARAADVDAAMVMYFHLFKLQLAYWFGEYAQAVEHAQACHLLQQSSPGAYAGSILLVFEALSHTQLALNDPARRGKAVGTVRHALRRLRFWARHSPDNFTNKVALLQAARAMLRRRWLVALQYCEQAAALAAQQGFIPERAMACELAAYNAQQLRLTAAANEYLHEAAVYFQKWGARSKVERLHQAPVIQPGSVATTVGGTTRTIGRGSLDLAALRKALKDIAEEKIHSRLIGKTIVAAAEFAGSQHAILLLDVEGELKIEAQLTSDMDQPRIMQSLAISDDTDTVVMPVVHYVSRTLTTTVIADALQIQEQIPGLHKWPAVLKRQVRSIMAVPLLEGVDSGRKLIGMLYLESNLAADAFTTGMIEALEIIGLAAAGRLELSRKAVTDGLTGLFNHDFFQQQLAEQCHLARRYHRYPSLILLDVDHFKKFNDTWGHQAGDRVLRQVAETLRQCCRVSDVVARYGGEEMVVILPETAEDDALMLAERMRAAIEQLAIDHEGQLLRVTASLGVSTCSDKLTTPAELVKAADTALYACKAAGRNCVQLASRLADA